MEQIEKKISLRCLDDEMESSVEVIYYESGNDIIVANNKREKLEIPIQNIEILISMLRLVMGEVN